MVIEDIDGKKISPQRVLKEGINVETKTSWYSNSGKFFQELTESLRPASVPNWVDFNQAIGANLEPYEEPYYRFPIFSRKIMVFNFDYSSEVFAHLEDMYDGGLGRYTVGIPSKKELIQKYWEGMTPIDDYLKHKPYKNPEIYMFEPVPSNLIEYIE